MKKYLFILIVPALFAACDKQGVDPRDFNILSNLPIDTGGVQKAFVHESTSSPYGFYAYTPSSYQEDGAEFPLLVFLHGSGEKGNSAVDPNKLELVLRTGIPWIINKDKWEPTYPMIVASPQCHDGNWNAEKIHEFIGHLIAKYRINTKRIYMTGLSMGASGTFSYVGNYANESYVAACVPICGIGSTGKAESFIDIPTWAFHGDADGAVSVNYSINMIDAINAFNPPLKAKMTVYPGVGHNSWSKTYDGTGMGTESNDYDAFDQSIYDWMFEFQKDVIEEQIQ